jgi:hypothetical protein
MIHHGHIGLHLARTLFGTDFTPALQVDDTYAQLYVANPFVEASLDLFFPLPGM